MDYPGSFEQVIEELKIGAHVSFKSKLPLIKITGELRDFFWKDNLFYIVIYSFLHRSRRTYILSKELKALPLTRLKSVKTKPSILLQEEWTAEEEHYNYKPLFLKGKIARIIVILLLAAFIFPYVSAIKLPFSKINYSYKEFLNREFSLEELYGTIRERMSYRGERDDNWLTPASAWALGWGDCEEFAAICSAYLTAHNYKNYLIGLTETGKNLGHAVVFINENYVYTIIDLNRAIEPFGVKNLPDCRTLKEAVALYSDLPAFILAVPMADGEKQIVEVIY